MLIQLRAIRPELLSLIIVLGLLCGPAQALIISTNNNLSDTENDAGLVAMSFPYWQNIGWRGTRTVGNDGSAIYLGDSWVLTANHVQAGLVQFGNTTYSPIYGSGYRIGDTDIFVFRIYNPPDLPSVPIATSTPSVGTNVLMLGTGRDQQVDRTYWDISGGVWTEMTPPPATWEAAGYKWASNRVKRWGTNTVSDINQTVSAMQSFFTTFDHANTDYEAQAADKDSGSSVFYQQGGEWKLSGMIFNILTYLGQPDYTAVDELKLSPYEGNTTIMADLSYYRDDILSAPNDPLLSLPGDANSDGIVDDTDLTTLAGNWQGLGKEWRHGDFNGDGKVDDVDLTILAGNWQESVLLSAGVDEQGSIPEPATATLLLLGGLIFAGRRKRLLIRRLTEFRFTFGALHKG